MKKTHKELEKEEERTGIDLDGDGERGESASHKRKVHAARVRKYDEWLLESGAMDRLIESLGGSQAFIIMADDEGAELGTPVLGFTLRREAERALRELFHDSMLYHIAPVRVEGQVRNKVYRKVGTTTYDTLPGDMSPGVRRTISYTTTPSGKPIMIYGTVEEARDSKLWR